MTDNNAPLIVWFRQDLRLKDNPALSAAAQSGRPLLFLYILDDDNAQGWAMGGASRWWLHQSLARLSDSLGGRLCFEKGDVAQILPKLIEDTGAAGVYWNRCYEPWRIKRDQAIKAALKSEGLEARSFNGSLLFEPQDALKSDGTPYKVFTPFYKNGCLGNAPPPRKPVGVPKGFKIFECARLSLDDLGLMPSIRWYEEMAQVWQPGEAGAQARMLAFFEEGLCDYKAGRDFPAKESVSRLSPHLHFGEISPHTLWQEARAVAALEGLEAQGEHFLRELVWREFSYSLLYHFPDLPRKNWQEKFDSFPWRDDAEALRRWQKGQTGYPIVDAGMRELWRTGYMHNRVRMIVGSFLVKNLLLHWHHGEEWFWDTLVDADLANNSASWQWVAGSGADASPYFRIFNPVTQGEKFDGRGEYVRRYVPELAGLPDKYLHHPWDAPAEILRQAGVVLGETYPKPIVDLKESRGRALDAFAQV